MNTTTNTTTIEQTIINALVKNAIEYNEHDLSCINEIIDLLDVTATNIDLIVSFISDYSYNYRCTSSLIEFIQDNCIVTTVSEYVNDEIELYYTCYIATELPMYVELNEYSLIYDIFLECSYYCNESLNYNDKIKDINDYKAMDNYLLIVSNY